MIVYISSCTTLDKKGGVYSYNISENGSLEEIDYLPCDRPMYTCIDNNKIYVLLREGAGKYSGVFSAEINDGVFGSTSEISSTNGREACHLTVKGRDVYVANYTTGNICRSSWKTVGFEGSGINPDRQDGPHTHCIICSPCENYVLVTDLGTDTIAVYDRDLDYVSKTHVPLGHGIRHIVFSPCGNYLYGINELACTVSAFQWKKDKGELVYIKTYDIEMPEKELKYSTGAAIRVSRDGSKLYVSVRGYDKLIVLDCRDPKKLSVLQCVSCEGSGPRDFNITPDERYLICTNEVSGNVTVFGLSDGMISKKVYDFELSKPLCAEIE